MGQKDLQQCMVISRLIELEHEKFQLNIVPTVREENGLAMSSRNMRLSHQLTTTPFSTLIDEGTQKIMNAGFDKIDYLAICDLQTLSPISEYNTGRSYAIIVAAFIEGIRLIDNIVIDLNT